MKRRSADGSVGSPHARVGNCQASNKAKGHPDGWPFCVGAKKCRMRRWRVCSSLLLLIRPDFASTPPQNQPAPQHH
ncbi:hypothetical protein B7C53_16020 [Escherichia coli]|nr:hypothetical protein B7C53_16020 [Escherichia coli]